MLLTDAVFQPEMSRLKDLADSNMKPMFSTDATFQAARFWLNAAVSAYAVALSNIPYMVLTDATFHRPRLALNVG